MIDVLINCVELSSSRASPQIVHPHETIKIYHAENLKILLK